jgi:hypothetical protein
MPFTELLFVCSANHTKPISRPTHCGKIHCSWICSMQRVKLPLYFLCSTRNSPLKARDFMVSISLIVDIWRNFTSRLSTVLLFSAAQLFYHRNTHCSSRQQIACVKATVNHTFHHEWRRRDERRQLKTSSVSMLASLSWWLWAAR